MNLLCSIVTGACGEGISLAQQRGLEAFCSWVLGSEDPQIRKLLPERSHAYTRRPADLHRPN